MSTRMETYSRMMALAILFAWAAGAAWLTPALADGGSVPPMSGGAAGGRTSRAPSSPSLSHLPPGTKVMLLDPQGDKLALGSQLAQDILNSGDPVWCPSTVAAPTPGSGGCTPSGITTLWDLINDINFAHTVAEPAANGTIWISGTSDSSASAITIDGSVLTTWAGFTLTLQGGWSGISGNKTISGQTTFTAPISIINWNNNVTLSDLIISGAGGTGLTITTTRNITLRRVQSNGNSGDGAYLDNSGGTGNVSITSGTFDSNNASGLKAFSTGVINLNTIAADGNLGGYGAYVDNSSAAGPQPVKITGANNTFNGNYLNGLLVYSYGSIAAANLHAEGNGAGVPGSNYLYSGGVQLENDFAGTGTITITGTNTFTDNYEDGLDVYSNGAITTNGLTADGNGLQGNPPPDWEWVGVALDNSSAVTHQNITLAGSNDLENNFNDGLDATASGVVTVNNLTARNNGISSVGTTSQLQGGVGAYLQGAKGVTLTGTSFFDGNYSTITFDDGNPTDYLQVPMGGLTIFSNGSIKANNVNAQNDLAGAGAVLDNCNDQGSGCMNTAGSITLTGLNTFTNNYLDGLDANSYGSITASNLNAGLNLGAGVSLINGDVAYASGLNSKGAVTLSGTNSFTDNLSDGLDVYSNGSISASHVQAVNNGGAGAVLDNSSSQNAVPLTGPGVSPALSSLSAQTAQSVKLTGSNVFSNNGFDGLAVYSNGAISLSSLSADGNGAGYGAYISNDSPGFGSKVTLSGNDSFNGNYLDGLDIVSYGTISVQTTSLIAEGNGIAGNNGVGVYLDNCVDQGSGCTAASARPVVLQGASVFNGNYGQYYDGVNTYFEAGLVIYSKGSITAGNVTANDTVNGAGALLDNTQGASSADIALTGPSEFNGNGGDGLDLNSHGAVTLTKVIADGNLGNSLSGYAGNGVYVGTVGKVTLSCGDLMNNAGYGIHVDASPLLTLKGTLLDDNTSGDVNYAGAAVESLACTLP